MHCPSSNCLHRIFRSGAGGMAGSLRGVVRQVVLIDARSLDLFDVLASVDASGYR